jgi:phosphoribosylanthranilate isomerase
MALFVKICGITRQDDAAAAVAAGADALGFVAWPRSRRHIAPDQAGLIMAALPSGIRRVGVFVDPTVAEIAAYLAAGIDVVQLHGGESAKFAREVALQAEVWKAICPKDIADVAAFGDYPAARFLIDAGGPTAPGGTGQTADWDLARRADGILSAPVLLAGGLTPENLAAAVAAVRPWGVDVSSGVEESPGIKSSARIRAFLSTARRLDPLDKSIPGRV